MREIKAQLQILNVLLVEYEKKHKELEKKHIELIAKIKEKAGKK